MQLKHNKMGYVESEQQDEYVVQHRYNKMGECIQITSSLGADIQLRYDGLGQVTHMQARQGSRLSGVAAAIQ